MLGERANFTPVFSRVVADEERARIDAGPQTARRSRIGFDRPDALDGMAAALFESNTGGGLTPRAAEIRGCLNGRAPPAALAGEHDGARFGHVREVVDLAAFEDRPAERPVAAPAVGGPDKTSLTRADKKKNLHDVDHIALGCRVSAIRSNARGPCFG